MAIRSYDWRRQSRPKGAVDCYADACAYPFTLFDKRTLANEPGWQPQVIVIALGTNDFTTPLNPGERWATRDVLHADFETTYVRFTKRLRARNPNALIVIWATDIAKGEIQMEAAKVAATLRASGDTLVDYVPVNGLSFTGCHAYPSLIDEAVIAGRIAAAIDSHSDVWSVGRPRPAY